MSTRASIHFHYTKIQKVAQAIVYRHSDGYPEGLGEDLKKFIAEVKDKCSRGTRFNDPSYLAAKWVVFDANRHACTYEMEDEKFVKKETHRLDFLGVGLLSADPFDIEFRYHVICSPDGKGGDPKVLCQEVLWDNKKVMECWEIYPNNKTKEYFDAKERSETKGEKAMLTICSAIPEETLRFLESKHDLDESKIRTLYDDVLMMAGMEDDPDALVIALSPDDLEDYGTTCGNTGKREIVFQGDGIRNFLLLRGVEVVFIAVDKNHPKEVAAMAIPIEGRDKHIFASNIKRAGGSLRAEHGNATIGGWSLYESE